MAEVVTTSFPADAEVGLYKRYGDSFDPGQSDPEQTQSVDKDGRAVFSDLPPDANYWAAAELKQNEDDESGEWKAVMVRAKDQAARSRLSPEKVREQLAQTRPPAHPADARVRGSGARSTLDAVRRAAREATGRPKAHEPTADDQQEEEPQPFAKQADVSDDVPQRSATPLGEATPKPEEEPQPKPSQDDVDDDELQRSDTQEGEATPIPPGEESDENSPSRRQEDVEDEPQRSDTETGEAVPKGEAGPRGTAKNPSSWEQARGERPVSTTTKNGESGEEKPKRRRQARKDAGTVATKQRASRTRSEPRSKPRSEPRNGRRRRAKK